MYSRKMDKLHNSIFNRYPSLRKSTRIISSVSLNEVGVLVGGELAVFLAFHYLPFYLVFCLVVYACFGTQQGGSGKASRASGEWAASLSLFVFCGSTNCRPLPTCFVLLYSFCCQRLFSLIVHADLWGKRGPLSE